MNHETASTLLTLYNPTGIICVIFSEKILRNLYIWTRNQNYTLGKSSSAMPKVSLICM